MGKFQLLLAIAFVAVACGGSGSSGDVPGTAAVLGYAYEGSPVVVVGIAADAPVGDVPVANAEVRAVNLHGTTLATVTTGSDGGFRLAGLPPGYVRVEVRKLAASAVPDATAEATGIAGMEVRLNGVHPVTRDDAIAAALAVAPPDTRVVASLQPFPAGTRIEPAGGDPGSDDPVPTVGRTLPADEWFLLVDLFPGASYAHPLQYVFVDATTGAVVHETNVQWPPLANGVDFWGGEWSLVGADGVDILSIDPATLPQDQVIVTSPEVAREPTIVLPAPLLAGSAREPRDILSELALHNTDPASIFVLLWVAATEDYRNPSVLGMLDLFKDAGVPSANIQVVLPETTRLAMQDSRYTSALNYLNELIEDRMQQGLHSTLVVWINSHGSGSSFGRYHGTGSNDYQSTQATDLQLTTTQACKVRVLLDFCYAREFGEILAGLFDKMQPADRPDYVVYNACDKTEFCYSIPYHYTWLTAGFLDTGGRFTDEFIENATIANGDITGCLNPTGTGISDSLSSLLGTLSLFPGDNNLQHPSAIVRRGWPARCIPAGTAGLVLDQNLTAQLVAGTFIPLSDIQGGIVSEPDNCSTVHLHSQTGITIAGVGGPFPDPSPTGCGYGSVVTR